MDFCRRNAWAVTAAQRSASGHTRSPVHSALASPANEKPVTLGDFQLISGALCSTRRYGWKGRRQIEAEQAAGTRS